MTTLPIWIIMPYGSGHGWGVCGKYLSAEMAKQVPVDLITEDISEREKEMDDTNRLTKHLPTDVDLKRWANSQGRYTFEHPLLQAAPGGDLKPWLIEAGAPRVIGYTFFEKEDFKKEDVLAAKEYFDWMVAGSTWCEGILKSFGFENSSTILQGVDSRRFHPGIGAKKRFKEHFVVFSGGKIELRKGQDLVIRAFKVLQDRHDDVLLVNSWYNMWDGSTATMGLSPHIRFDMPPGDYEKAIAHLMVANGIDPERIVTVPPRSNRDMAEIYRDTDCGLFPNRCEGGTNLVLMEYMACGKPAIASYNTGHRDILNAENCLPIETMKALIFKNEQGDVVKKWDDPDLDEIIDKLEWAYQHPQKLQHIGRVGHDSIKPLSWEKAAGEFYDLLER